MRAEALSSLDFAYWMLESVEENYCGVGNPMIFDPSLEGDTMHLAVIDASLICGVETPRKLSALLAKAERYRTLIDAQTAVETRGAILHKNGLLYMSVGDGKRLVGADNNERIGIYEMPINELLTGYWDGALLVPELRYL